MTKGHVVGLLIAAGCILQGTYIFARDVLPLSPMLAVLSAALMMLSLSAFLKEVGRSTVIFGLGLTFLVYVLALSIHFRGLGLFGFILTPITLILFYLLLCGIRHRAACLMPLAANTHLVVGLVALVQVPAAALWLRDNGWALGLGWNSFRYGFRDGVNLVNLTGANLALVFCAGYAFARLAPFPAVRRAIALAASLGLLAPVMATQSRGAILMCVVMVLLVEIRLITSKRSFRDLTGTFAVLLVAALGLVYLIAAYWDSLLGSLIGGLGTRLTETITQGDALRSNAFRAALQVDNPLFGTFRPGGEVSFGARDNAFSNYLLSYGLIGFALGSVFYFGAIWSMGRSLGRSRWFAPLIVLPLLPRSLGEGNYITTSSVFCVLFLIVVVIAVTPGSRRAETPGAWSGASLAQRTA
jgi:hypothetical protein